jgi:hypothetical protein
VKKLFEHMDGPFDIDIIGKKNTACYQRKGF